MQSGDDSLWESFPHVLETLEGARRYISAFGAPLQELSALSLAQIHTLRACSLLAIPPPLRGCLHREASQQTSRSSIC